MKQLSNYEREFMVQSNSIREDKFKLSDLSIYLMKVEKNQIKPQISRRNEQ